ncbi:MAG: Rrf2 family transcriptional regulator [Luteolibacter sp.]|jgi:Rrf2 family protein|nr:Rrf2 family transcriptional regulator [Luteolibacter sp.]
MKISKRGEYAMRSLIDLAMACAVGRDLVPLSALAESQNIPGSFLEQILMQLKRAGILKSTRGKYGGYALAKPAKEIIMGDLVRLIDGPLAPIACASQTAYAPCSCPDEAHCGLRLLMVDVRQSISNVMDKYSLEQVANVTLTKLQEAGLEPEVVHQIRHMSLEQRAKKIKKFIPPQAEPDFMI